MSEANDEGPLFGTDGIRGRAGEGWLRPERVAALGRAAGARIGETTGTRRALTGHDGRRSGPELEAALAAGLAASGFEVTSTGIITTPGLAWLTRKGDFGLGAMLSASHNPARDNGIKLFGEDGSKLADELESRIEELVRAEPDADGFEPMPPMHDPDLEKSYLEHLTAAVEGLKLDGTTVVLDCANGGGSRVAPHVFGRLGARVVSIGAEPDGDNINDGVGSTAPDVMLENVRMHSADIGIALDGDGDRCILSDEHGRLIDGDGILTILGRHAAAHTADSRLVATVMSNRGLHRALREVGTTVVTVGVGDRRVAEAMREHGLTLGGEQSGHVLFGDDHAFIGDGVYTALRVLAVLKSTDEPISALAAPYQPLPQVLLNVPVTSKPELETLPGVADAVRGVEAALGEDGRVLLRYSGTEPLARVMVEGDDEDAIRRHAQEIAGLVSNAIGAR